MRKLILLTVAFSTSHAFSQAQPDLNTFNRQRIRITKNAMIALGSWSAANLIYSGIATGQTTGTTRYFHQMNVMWGGINLGLAALSYIGLKNKDGLSLVQSLKQQAGIEKTYMLNAGLDVAYIASGLYLKERSKSNIKISNQQKLKGYGESIILQGAALLLLDGVMFTVHNIHGKKLYKMIDKVQLAVTGNGVSMVVKL
ncbi:MAG: hypothetical protein ABI741_02010 [Ferruginibacter sp.]